MNSYKGISVGDKVVVTDNGHTFDMFDTWQDIKQVPYFSEGAAPTNGQEYIVTFIGAHSGDDFDDWTIFVLNEAYMMNHFGLKLA